MQFEETSAKPKWKQCRSTVG